MNRSQTVLLVLLASLALNLLAGGVYLGRMLDGPRRHGPPPMDWAARGLSEEQRAAVREHMRAQLPRARPLREQLRSASREVRRLAEVPELDSAALSAALGNLRDAHRDYQAFMHDNLLAVAATLPPAQRLALLREALRHRGARRGPHRTPPERDDRSSPTGSQERARDRKDN